MIHLAKYDKYSAFLLPADSPVILDRLDHDVKG